MQNGNIIIKSTFQWRNRKNKLDTNIIFELKIKSPSKLVRLSQMAFWSSPEILPFLLEYICKQVSTSRERPDSINPPTQFHKHLGFYMWYHSVIKWKPLLLLYPCHCADFSTSNIMYHLVLDKQQRLLI